MPDFKCPTRMPDGTRLHKSPVVAWIQAKAGSDRDRKAMRPACGQCLLTSRDSVLVAQDIFDFYKSQRGVEFAVILASVERYRRMHDARLLPEEDSPRDAARSAEFAVLDGVWDRPYASRRYRRVTSLIQDCPGG